MSRKALWAFRIAVILVIAMGLYGVFTSPPDDTRYVSDRTCSGC